MRKIGRAAIGVGRELRLRDVFAMLEAPRPAEMVTGGKIGQSLTDTLIEAWVQESIDREAGDTWYPYPSMAIRSPGRHSKPLWRALAARAGIR